jgi:type IV pilus assembly protein PilM
MAGKRAYVGLDIGSTSIKGIELQENRGQFQLLNFHFQEVSAADDPVQVLSRFFREGGFKSRRVVTAVSGRSVIVRYVPMSKMSDDELRNAIRFEAGKFIPFEVEDVILDCQRLDEEGKAAASTAEGEMRVLLVAVKRSTIDSHVRGLEAAGLIPTIIDVDSFALGNAYELRLLSAGAEEQEQVTALVDVGASKTNINIMWGRTSFFTREIYLAGNDFTEAIVKKMSLPKDRAERLKREPGEKAAQVRECVSTVLDDFCHEVDLSFDFFENQYEREVEKIYISGGGALLPELEESFSQRFGRPVSRWNPLEPIDLSAADVDQEQLIARAGQLAIAVGLASRVRRD